MIVTNTAGAVWRRVAKFDYHDIKRILGEYLVSDGYPNTHGGTGRVTWGWYEYDSDPIIEMTWEHEKMDQPQKDTSDKETP